MTEAPALGRTAPPAPEPDDTAALPSRVVHLLEVASVFGRTFAVEDLVDVLGEPIGKVLEALREALAVGVLVADGNLLVFRDKRVQRAIYHRVPEPIRDLLHHRIGLVLLRRGGSAAPAASHLIDSARPVDGRLLPVLDRASRELSGSAPQAAAALALRVLQLTDPATDEWFARVGTAVEALIRAKRGAEAARLAGDALLRHEAPVACRARLRLALSGLDLAGARVGSALAGAEAVLEERHLPDDLGDAATAARLLALLALDDTPRVQETAEAILAGAAGPGGDLALAMASLALAWVAWDEGRAGCAIGLARAAVQRCDRSGIGRTHRLYPRLSLAMMLTSLGSLVEADAVVARAAEEITPGADPLYSAAPTLLLARVHYAAGRLDRAAAVARASLVAAEDADAALFLPLARAIIARVAVRGGDLQEAVRQLGPDRETVGPHPRLGRFAPTWAAAELAAARDGPAAARERLDGVYRALPGGPALLLEEPDAAARLTRLALATDERGLAESVVACAETLAAGNPAFRSIRAAALHARGLLEDDAALLEQAEDLYAHPVSAASAAEDAGVSLARHDPGPEGQDAAGRALGRAIAAYEQAGAVADTDRVRACLRAIGVRPTHWSRAERPPTGWCSLTDTELRVARIVSEGATNAQAANRLYLSRHTVDFHLRQIFRKLGIQSRVQLARLALEHAPEPTVAHQAKEGADELREGRAENI